VALVSEPGEYFGSIREALSRGVHAAGGVFVVGGAQDFLGYEYPAYVTPFTNLGGDELIFGPSATLGDQTVTAGETEAQLLGFRVDPTSNAETTALEQDYTRVAQTGVWLLPSVTSGDLGPSGTFSPTLLAAADPARARMGCDNPALLFTPGDCPSTDPALGPFTWSFGDGTAAVTAVQGRARASFSPFLRHAYRRPGVYRVTVSITAGGSTDSMTLPITVHPALRAVIGRDAGTASAHMRGGDGHLLLAVWTLPDGSHAFGPSVRLPRHGAVRLAVVDGTGTVATTTVRV
jgi:hypothetical protein